MVVVEHKYSVQIVSWESEAGRPQRNDFAPDQIARSAGGKRSGRRGADPMRRVPVSWKKINAVRDHGVEVDQFDFAAVADLQAAKGSLPSHKSEGHCTAPSSTPPGGPSCQPVTGEGTLAPSFDARCQQGQFCQHTEGVADNILSRYPHTTNQKLPSSKQKPDSISSTARHEKTA